MFKRAMDKDEDRQRALSSLPEIIYGITLLPYHLSG